LTNEGRDAQEVERDELDNRLIEYIETCNTHQLLTLRGNVQKWTEQELWGRLFDKIGG